MPSETDAKPHRGVIQVLLKLARHHKGQFAVISLFALLATGADLLQPLVYRRAINDVAGLFVEQTSPAAAPVQHRPGFVAPRTADQTLRTLIESVGFLFLISTAGYYFSLRSDYFGAKVASTMEADLIVSTFGHVLRLPTSFFARRASAGIAKRIDQSDQLAPVVHAFSQQIAPEAIRLVGICAIMFAENWEMALVSLSMLPPYLWIARRSALRMKTGLEPYYELWENISARITGALAAVKTVKLSGAESREEDRLGRESNYAYGVYIDRIRTAQGYYIWQSVLSNLSKSMVLGYGGWLVLRRRLTPGDVVMFAAYLDRLFAPVDSLNNIAVSLQQHLISLTRAIRLRDEGPVEAPGDDLPPGPGKVEFRDVRFSYIPAREVLKGINLTLEPGRTTALAGPSGAGKTTTADLLLKLFEPTAGEILIDGHSIAAKGPAPVRRAIGVVATDGAVFRGTLADNIRYKRPTATDADVMEAALAAGLGRLLERLPEGLETEIGENGVGLSVGERQRLQIARILADKPRLLVLDEATANLDYATEIEIKHSLLNLNPRPTTLIIAHRYTMIKEADYVYVLRDGQVTEQGTPAQLLAAGGWFAELAEQSGLPEPPASPPIDVVEEEDE
ncbi:MAG: ABC transporter ATP-binding protein [Acidobacteria bacterium]|nr:ABC transporter ATP-binding protein [Acidobacteriota bacterium]